MTARISLNQDFAPMRPSLLSFVFALALVVPSVASAQRPPRTPPPQMTPSDSMSGDDAAARLLYERGAEAYAAGDYATALDRFQQAYGLSHRPQLLYNIGTTLDRLRRDREALTAFDQFLAEVPEHPRRAEVDARARVLRATIEQEDREAAEAAARAQQEREAAEAARVAAEQEAERSRLAREEAERRAAEASDGLPPAVVISVGSAAIVAGAIGIVFGVQARNRNDDYRALANQYASDGDGTTVTSAQYGDVRDARNDAQSSQRLANICLFGSAALTAGAVTLIFFTDWGGSDDAPTSLRTVPIVSAAPGYGFAGVSHSF